MDKVEFNHALPKQTNGQKRWISEIAFKHLVVSSLPSERFLFPSLPSLSSGVAYFGLHSVLTFAAFTAFFYFGQ